MPRSVNSVASRARRKRMLKAAKGYWGRRSNVWTVAKNAVEKGWGYAYRDRKAKREISENFGFNVSMQEHAMKECRILRSWVN